MTRSILSRAIGAIPLPLLLLFVACDDPTALAVEDPVHPEAALSGLAIGIPTVRAVDLQRVVIRRFTEPGPDGPEAAPALSEPSASDESMAIIYRPKTTVGFMWGQAYAEGSHDFVSTASSISTTVEVLFNAVYVGSQTTTTQDSYWYPTFQSVKHISAYAAVDAPHSCGLSVRGSSEHAAWYEWFLVFTNFGRERVGTSAQAAQEPCGQTSSDHDPTGRHNTTGGISCTYSIWYDLATLEIVSVELLGCTSGDGILI